MKIKIIKACTPSVFKEYKKFMAAPPQSIFSLAASTPDVYDVELIDETIDMQVNYETDAELIVIFFSTPDAMRGYALADKFRMLGKTVVLGGLHVKFNKFEALKHADTLLIGETEGIWEQLLIDYSKSDLRKVYERTSLVDLKDVKAYPTDLISPEDYGHVWSVLVSRGCVNKCSYCTVHKFFDSMRYRPIDDVINEIRGSGAKIVELHSDNLTADREYAKTLFEKLMPLNIKWVAETTADFANDDELVELAAKSGLVYLLLGLETPSSKALENLDKGFMRVEEVKAQIKKLHKHGIIVDSAMMFGVDGQTEDIFDETIKFVKEIDLDVAHAVVPIPFPGTNFFRKLESQGRILTYDWSNYDGRHLVYKHDVFNNVNLGKGLKKFEENAYTLKGYLRYQKFLLAMEYHVMF